MPRVVQRAHRRLHQAAPAGGGTVVAPRFERRVRRQDQVRARRRLVRPARRRGDEGHGVEGRREVGGGRQRVRRIDLVQQQQLDLPGPHGVRQIEQIAAGRSVVPRVVGREPHRGADVSRDVVEQGDGDLRLGGVRSRNGDAAAGGQGAARPGSRIREGPRELHDAPGRHAAPRGGRFRGPVGDQGADAGQIVARDPVRLHPALRHDGPHHRRRQRALRARLDADPLVGARRGQRQPRLEVDGAHGSSVARAPGVRVRAGVAHGRQPRLQEVGAERHDEIRPAEVVIRNGRAVEGDPVRGPQRLVGERLVAQPARSAEGRRPAVDQGVERSR